MQYAVTHRTTYRYHTAVLQSYHLLHLSPRRIPHQTIMRHRIATQPQVELRSDLVDFFGNPYSVVAINADHKQLVVEAQTELDVAAPPPVDLAATSDWQTIAHPIDGASAAIPLEVAQYAVGSRHGRRVPALAEFASQSFRPGKPVLAAAYDLMQRIHDEFTFDASATDISTPVEAVLRDKRGVCQDFAHLMISALRSIKLPARYVSGYIRTIPPDGRPRLQGADASHAWVSVWAPETGWVDFDPTNDTIISDDHITIAYGRDYDDVSPISGVLLGGGPHSVDVAVDVVPLG